MMWAGEGVTQLNFRRKVNRMFFLHKRIEFKGRRECTYIGNFLFSTRWCLKRSPTVDASEKTAERGNRNFLKLDFRYLIEVSGDSRLHIAVATLCALSDEKKIPATTRITASRAILSFFTFGLDFRHVEGMVEF